MRTQAGCNKQPRLPSLLLKQLICMYVCVFVCVCVYVCVA